MADFRRWFLALAVVVLAIGSTVPANAQAVGPAIVCNVNTSVQPTLRHEGLTELIGDIVLICNAAPNSTGSTPPTQDMPQANISVSLGATLSTSSIGLGLDALLTIDDPTPANQDVCQPPTNGLACAQLGNNGQTFNQPGRFNVFQGISGGPGTNSITFLGVPVDPAATGSRIYRITNVRIQGPSVPAGAFGLTPVYAYVSASTSTAMTISEATQPIVGFVSQGLNVTATGTSQSFLQCVSQPIGDNPNPTVGTITFTENFPTAFKTQCSVFAPDSTTTCAQTQPGLVYYSESGLNIPIPGYATTGEATTATELEAVITNIPSGVQVYVDSTMSDGLGTSATLISPASSGGATLLIDTTSATGVSSATAVWEITSANANAVDSLMANIYTSFSGSPGANGGSPMANTTAYAQGGFAPQEPGGWVNGGPVPEFVVGVLPAAPGAPLFTVSLCQTILLFPYVTDYYGFDTGIAISNTSLDNLPVGASNQTGACSVAFYDDGGLSTTIGTTGNTPGYVNSDVTYGAATPINGSGMISPGQTWAFSLSNTDMGYNSVAGYGATGYAIATCDFQFAHGYSFVSDTGIRNFAAAYLALVIPDAPRAPQPFVCASVGSGYCAGQAGEQLVH
ncbi:MAG: hypothetical protein ACLP59_00870 [Bryobacteraceae bacterium]